MELLYQIAKQRNTDQKQLLNYFLQQQSLSKTNVIKYKQYYETRQKERKDKQNWNIKLLKNNKNLSLQVKQNILQVVKQMMSIYSNTQYQNYKDQQNQKNQNNFQYLDEQMQNQKLKIQMQHFTQIFINLFVDFYNKNRDQVDPQKLKQIVRPNNNFIIIDLIKSFLDFQRNKFKETINQSKIPSQKIKTQLSQSCNTIKILPSRFSIKKKIDISVKFLAHTQQSKVDITSQIFSQNEDFKTQKQAMLYDKCNKFLSAFDANQIQERVNVTFFALTRLNQINKNIISNFRDDCFGKRKNINYNYSGLYSQSQKSLMIKKLENDIKQFQKLEPLKKNDLGDQFRLRFKKFAQLEDRKQSLLVKISTKDKVHPFMSLKIQQTPNDLQPLRLVLIRNKQYVPLNKFKQSSKQPINDYLQQKLNQKYQKYGLSKSISPEKSYLNKIKKQLCFDFGNKKVKQLLLQDKMIAVKKQAVFPFIRKSSSRERKYKNQVKQRDMSQRKLTTLKNYELSNNIKKQFLKRANTSSQCKISLSCKGQRQRVPYQPVSYNFITRQKHLSTNNI